MWWTNYVTDDPAEVEHTEAIQMFMEMRSLKSIYWTQVLFYLILYKASLLH